MSLIEEALRRLGEQDAPARVPRETPNRRKVERPHEPDPLPASTPPATVSPQTSAPPVSVGPWLGFWATVGGSAALLVVGLLLGTLWNARPVSPISDSGLTRTEAQRISGSSATTKPSPNAPQIGSPARKSATPSKLALSPKALSGQSLIA